MLKITWFTVILLLLTQIATAGNPDLPVKMIFAEGRIFKHEVKITWSTEYEQVSGDFIVEGSHDQKSWMIRGKVKSSGGQGNPAEYHFQEPRENAFSYYRIRMLDSKGNWLTLKTFEAENYIIDVDLEPVQLAEGKRLCVSYLLDRDQEILLRIYDHLGQQVVTRILPSSGPGDFSYILDVSHLAEGNYLLVITQVLSDMTVAEQQFKL